MRDIDGRLYLTFREAVTHAKQDAYRLARLMADGRIAWAFDADGVIWIQLQDLELITGVMPVRTRTLLRPAGTAGAV